MNFAQLYDFLEELQQNNSKEWMDAHRKRYHQIRDDYIKWLDMINQRLLQIDSDYYDTPGKKAINRINNNLLYHPNKPIYKDHFGAGLDQRSKQGDFYIHLGVSESFVAGGYWKPGTKILTSIREAIDYNGEEFLEIINKKSFKNTFGNLIETEDKLTNAPKGFSQDHRFIDLLRHKTFAVEHRLNKKEVIDQGFDEKVIALYKEMLPFRRYLNQAVTV
ncbi:DUF2461 domain-containing protein [Aquimarina brevivitae]|uniref:Uncharacterized protein (TIGR02453 family) n=1 Tax=Aquimarina brevivitae TaxID=323412 RepID=A0A4Q7NY71_9FLAO|nr:DUF2461 domain-containing protein [Aquimarina brevivitae]RZS92255.1 uncharacterized protein (TIGR02453 family) [Aquimarina brevivitae]